MDIFILLALGVSVAVFVGFNIGGSSTGVAFGPAVGSKVISKFYAAILMSIFALLGGWTVGRNVVKTMGGLIVPKSLFSIEASVAILFFIGLALLVSNVFGVPASTSMTAVGAIAGLGVATGKLNWGIMGKIVSWWIVAPVIAFWVCAIVGRYLYPYLQNWLKLDESIGKVFKRKNTGIIPFIGFNKNAAFKEIFSSFLVVIIGCYMAFSAGASNVANAIAPLYGNGGVTMNQGIILAAAAIGLGAFTIAKKTLATVGNELTDLPLLAALVVEIVSASLITFLSWIGSQPALQ